MEEDKRKYWGAGDYSRERQRKEREQMYANQDKRDNEARLNRMAADLAAIRKELEKKNED